eukprot:TRINITY_DN289_c0_g1_i1.p1 TRINITY_DN289_c0_g1~~TRINITY_DN289_c0_g1_i1.p1  ORF type:complete len:415 (-),score=47.36 TRINITY_DN289_c0_g1_i1:80-1138(-)
MAGYNAVKPTGILPPPYSTSTSFSGPKRNNANDSGEYINIEILNHRGKSFIFFDLGGQIKHRAHWKNYIVERVFAIIYVVDSSDHDRLDEARDVLHSIVDPLCPLTITPLVIFNHKVDKPGALPNKALLQALDLHNLKRIVNWRVFSSNIVKPRGVPITALDYLADMHQNQRLELTRELEEKHDHNQHPSAVDETPTLHHYASYGGMMGSASSSTSSGGSGSPSSSPLMPTSLTSLGLQSKGKGKERWPEPAPDAITTDGSSAPFTDWWDSNPAITSATQKNQTVVPDTLLQQTSSSSVSYPPAVDLSKGDDARNVHWIDELVGKPNVNKLQDEPQKTVDQTLQEVLNSLQN